MKKIYDILFLKNSCFIATTSTSATLSVNGFGFSVKPISIGNAWELTLGGKDIYELIQKKISFRESSTNFYFI